jgi:hypothetical protein
MRLDPLARAAQIRARFEMLFDPGTNTEASIGPDAVNRGVFMELGAIEFQSNR